MNISSGKVGTKNPPQIRNSLRQTIGKKIYRKTKTAGRSKFGKVVRKIFN